MWKGTAMTDAKELLINVLRAKDASRSRSVQTQVGPSELASIYGESPYTQATAESEVFKLAGEQEARNQRQRVE